MATRAGSELLRESVALARAPRIVRWAGFPVTGVCHDVLVAARLWSWCDALAWTRPGHYQPDAALWHRNLKPLDGPGREGGYVTRGLE